MKKHFLLSIGSLFTFLVLVLSACDGDLPDKEPPTAMPGEISIGCDVDQLITLLENPDPDGITIYLASCEYVLQEPYDDNNAFPQIETPVTIIGQDGTIITRGTNAAVPEFRFFHLNPDGELHIENVVFSNGDNTSLGTIHYGGGAVFNLKGVFTCKDCTFQDNNSFYGGAYMDRGPGSEAEFINCDFMRNNAHRGGAVYLDEDTSTVMKETRLYENEALRGGAIYAMGNISMLDDCVLQGNQAVTGGGAYILSHNNEFNSLIVHGNHAATDGGGIYMRGHFNHFDDCVINGNTAGLDQGGYGGGFFVSMIPGGYPETLVFEDTELSNNQAGNGGGAIYTSETVHLNYSTVFDNQADYGGAVYIDSQKPHRLVGFDHSYVHHNQARFEGGAVFSGTTTVQICAYGTTFANNQAGGPGAAIIGGGLQGINSTFSGNRSGEGSVIDLSYITELYYVTITENISGSDSPAFRFLPGGYETSNCGILHSIIINNKDAGGSTFNCDVTSSVVYGENWDDDGSCPGFTINLQSDLNPLADNGGSAPTHGIPLTSPARNACNCDEHFPVTNDQRDMERPQWMKCDIGAYEFEENIEHPPTVSFIENTNCRLRPDNSYPVLTSFKTYQKAEVVGRNFNQTHFEVVTPGLTDSCWVWADLVELDRDIEEIPVKDPEVVSSPEEEDEEDEEKPEPVATPVPPSLNKHF